MKITIVTSMVISLLLLVAGITIEGNIGIGSLVLGFGIIIVLGIGKRFDRIERRFDS